MGVSSSDLKEAFGAISRGVATESRSRVRVLSGAARGTIREARTKNKAVVRAGNNSSVVYAGVLNYHRPGDEFLTGPANENTDQHVAMIERELADLIVRYGLR